MQYSTGETGRIFVIRLEDGDKLPDTLEKFAEEHQVKSGICTLVGGVRADGKVVTGPRDEEKRPISPILQTLAGVHEILAIATLFPDTKGKAKLHMHASMGREKESITGCIRPGIEIWQVGEVILMELINTKGYRAKDESSGFELLKAL